MRIFCEPPWSVAWMVTRVRPPALSATFVVKGAFVLKPGGPAEPAPKAELPSGDKHQEDDEKKPLTYVSDFAPLKPRTDLLLLAACHAPGGKSAAVLRAGFSVGAFAKTVAVIGKRRWKPGLLAMGQTEPEPFKSMPVTWDRAYGGKGYKKNPVGCGRVKEAGDLPNIENPDRLLRGPADAIDPAGFAPVHPAWEPRSDLKGTFKAKWLAERWPWFPEDFDFGIYNGAPRDQQIEGALKGDEELTFDNLHPAHAKFTSRLPGLRARCFVGEKVDGKASFREVPLKLDTLWIDLEAGKLVLVWRGMIDVRSLKLKELEGVLIRAESLKDPPLPLDQVRAAFEAQMAALAAPPEMEEPAPPAAALPSPAPKATAEGVKGALAAGRSLANTDLSRADLTGLDLAGRDLHGAVLEGASLKKAKLAGANLMDADLTRADLSEADLTGANLKNADLTRARLPKAILKKAKLDGAKFERANLAEADLDECEGKMTSFFRATLKGAKLRKAKFGLTDFTKAVLDGADFSGAELKATDIGGASAAGALFREADLTNFRASTRTNARKADFKLAKGAKTVWIDAALDGADFSGAQLPGADFTGASLAGAIFKRGDFTKGSFADADLRKASLPQVNLLRASFERADLGGADFQGSNLYEADFWDAKTAGADFKGANLKKTRLG
ncbi:MAG TPA: DUF2169 domain-containing protein [Planctomycetota bacterium]